MSISTMTYKILFMILFIVFMHNAFAVTPENCEEGYVWRQARIGDHVCVVPAIRDLVAQENNNQHLTREATPRTQYVLPLSVVSILLVKM